MAWGCHEVLCGVYVETPVLAVCWHAGVVPFVRCALEAPDPACTEHLQRE
jgi:hypothetical protein